MLDDIARSKLAQDLPREVVRTRSQAGQTLSYVDGAYVLRRLSEVFGPDGWSFDHDPVVIRDGARPVVHVRGVLTAAGVKRADTGVGLAAGEKPDALETAIKAAVTDCLKRCARTFGASLGLALYDKDQADVGLSFAAQELIAAYDRASTHADIGRARVQVERVWPELAAEDRAAVQAAAARAKTHVARVGSTDAAEQPAAPATAQRPPSGEHRAAQPVTDPLDGAQSPQTIVAVVLARGETAESAAAVRAATRLGVTDLARRIEGARKAGATGDQWQTVARVLLAVDAARTAEELTQARKAHAPAVLALPEALLSGVKAACDARAKTLGAPTVASVLIERAKVAQTGEELQKIHTDLTAAVAAKRITSEADARAVTNALNARAEWMDSSQGAAA